ncbi:sulfite exporter TauE/SafE family protein [Psychrosphaera aestuarii]|uniref:sulfite exporter TauE/SafE family protein n=1 Tax=Psychrosphaera aestuarii TaxID=1266052 RepID=UPI001B3276FC|nr:sulfite exporter TauE/SafE family protein [Psychrosphaera aestuarii]
MSLLLTAFLMGLLGVGHCVAMCGSLSMALGFSVPANKSFVRYASIISLSRITGYALIGIIANYFTQSIFTLTNGNILFLSVFASLLMIGIGLHVAQISNAILNIEWLGKHANRVIEPLKKKILPIDSLSKCFAYGILWGFLPCGLIYTALSLAVVSESPINAGLIMFCFGLGTLPGVVGMTVFNSKISIYLRNANIRLFFGTLIIIMALYQLYVTYQKLTGID